MEFDPAELEAITTDPFYLEQMEICRRLARENKATGDKNPPKNITDNMIEFYGSERGGNNDQYGKWFSNCVFARIEVDGEKNNSSEHYYQRRKFLIDENDPIVRKWCKERSVKVDTQIRNNQLIRDRMATLSPVAVAKFGQSMRDAPIRGDWEQTKYSVMWKALVAKFTQNPEFAEKLKSTGEKVLIERAPTDAIWAVNNGGLGTNMLGAMLMLLRSFLE